MSINDILDKVIRKPYYYVPPCPECGSKKTGKIILSHDADTDQYIVETALKNGELTTIQDEYPFGNNLYCDDCGFTWWGRSKLMWVSPGKILEEKTARGTVELLDKIKDTSKPKKKSGLQKFLVFRSPTK